MARGSAAFRQDDVKRAVAGCRKAGLDVVRVEIEGGRIVVITATGEPGAKDGNEWDRV